MDHQRAGGYLLQQWVIQPPHSIRAVTAPSPSRSWLFIEASPSAEPFCPLTLFYHLTSSRDHLA